MPPHADLDGADAEGLEAGRLLFAKPARFVMGVVNIDQVPPSAVPEVAFAGRSNVGKSSLMNALTGRKALARTSNTPGRTREVNFFDVDGRLMLADLPGYGFAKAPKKQVQGWTQLIEDYLRGRAELRRCCLLIDARHGIKPTDRDAMSLMDRAAQPYQIVLTKCDKMKPGPLAEIRDGVGKEIARRPAAHPRIVMTSARDGAGIDLLRAELAAIALSFPGQRG
ncbi:MAG: ribosome biogenesis GTP-binding protein YihA/YsxC [Proteobacteria bacterium]|nr:ribosome biogenesis GTP-binding protein YihA/YsxC [Pseudomonadota bacterium]